MTLGSKIRVLLNDHPIFEDQAIFDPCSLLILTVVLRNPNDQKQIYDEGHSDDYLQQELDLPLL
jgi:hypothetical protein